MTSRRLLLAAFLTFITVRPADGWADPALPLVPGSFEGAALLARLRRGGLVLFFRHADTAGEPCDRSFRVSDRPGRRNISPARRRQAAEIGARLAALGIPVGFPVLAGPVFLARDTAELAFGAAQISVTDGLLSDDYAGSRLGWVQESIGASSPHQCPIG